MEKQSREHTRQSKRTKKIKNHNEDSRTPTWKFFELFSTHHHLQFPFFPANPPSFFILFSLFSQQIPPNFALSFSSLYDLRFHFLYHSWMFLLPKEGSSKSSSSVTVGELHFFCFTFYYHFFPPFCFICLNIHCCFCWKFSELERLLWWIGILFSIFDDW